MARSAELEKRVPHIRLLALDDIGLGSAPGARGKDLKVKRVRVINELLVVKFVELGEVCCARRGWELGTGNWGAPGQEASHCIN